MKALAPLRSCLLSLSLLATFLASPSDGQILDQVLSLRDPLELASGRDSEQDLILVAALFGSPAQISVFTGSGDGLGIFSEEIVVASGDAYFGLSSRIHCRQSTCWLTAVNAESFDVELFTRSSMGQWSRSTAVAGGVYFSSDLGLNQNALTIQAYDAVAFEQEVWRSNGGGPFTQIDVRPQAAGAIYGANRASLGTDPESGDYLVTFDDAGSLPSTVQNPVTGSPLRIAKEKDAYPVRAEGMLWGSPIELVTDTITVTAPGVPLGAQETFSEYICGFFISLYKVRDTPEITRTKMVVVNSSGVIFGPVNVREEDETSNKPFVVKVNDPENPGEDPEGLELIAFFPDARGGMKVQMYWDPTIDAFRVNTDIQPGLPWESGQGTLIEVPASSSLPGTARVGHTRQGSVIWSIQDVELGVEPDVQEVPTLGPMGGAALILFLLLGSLRALNRGSQGV